MCKNEDLTAAKKLGLYCTFLVIYRAKIKNQKSTNDRYQKCLINKHFRLKIGYPLKTYYSPE